MFAILTEHWGGKWPLWVSPRQCMVVPISGGRVGVMGLMRAMAGGGASWAQSQHTSCAALCAIVHVRLNAAMPA
jgi:hypothetical protein